MGSLFLFSLHYMAWTKPIHERPRINQAGQALLNNALSDAEKDLELDVVNNWRSAHGYPLQCIKMALKGRAKRMDRNAIVAQRVKRLPSILAKLKREPQMRLSQMQDIGGCRAIVSTIRDVDKLVKAYQEAKAKNPTRGHQQASVKDYITNPKPDGYRSVHLVYKYRSGSKKHSIFNDQKIELQIRSRLQHAWATAVEIVDACTGQALKSGLKLNLGDPKWRRFFVLMSSAIALRESRPPVPGSLISEVTLKKELKTLAKELRVVDLLSSLSAGLNLGQELGQKHPETTAYLLRLHLRDKQVFVTAFTEDELPDANEQYLRIEKDNQDNPNVLAVLVAVESMKALRTAYPNYYLDSGEFIKALKKAIK